MKQIISKEDVAKAISDLLAQGKKPTLAILHAALQHRGSMSTLVRLKAEVEAAAQPESDSPEALKAFREIWALAVDEGRIQQEAVTAELRGNLKALAAENERLEGTAIAAQERATELEHTASRAEAELNRIRAEQERQLSQAQAALVQASAQAAEALQKLSDVQAARSAEVAALQTELVGAVGRAHELELKLVRAQALLEAKGMKAEKA
jgi:predicted  nucleic acid-binding Zn-ribbon protein